MPKQSFPLASFSDRDTCGLGWLESGFCESLGKRRLLMSEESGDPPNKDAYFMTFGRGCDAECAPLVRRYVHMPSLILLPFLDHHHFSVVWLLR